MAFELLPLPYDSEALAPAISAETLKFHHGKHHQAYIDKTNAAIAGTDLADADLETVIAKSRGSNQGLFNNAAQSWTHGFYWHSLSPAAIDPSGALADRIDESPTTSTTRTSGRTTSKQSSTGTSTGTSPPRTSPAARPGSIRRRRWRSRHLPRRGRNQPSSLKSSTLAWNSGSPKMKPIRFGRPRWSTSAVRVSRIGTESSAPVTPQIQLK